MTGLAGGKFTSGRRSSLVQSLIDGNSRRMAPPSQQAKAFDFKTLPDYQQLRVQRAAADFLGIASPFFREVEGAAGPTCQIDGRELINFSSYDYLGLNHHPEIRSALAGARASLLARLSAPTPSEAERNVLDALRQAIHQPN